MARMRDLAGAAMVALGAVGCAHCDTCDDMPRPCLGADCGGGGPIAATYGVSPEMVVAPSYTVRPADPAVAPGIVGAPAATPNPAPANQPGPFSAPAAATSPIPEPELPTIAPPDGPGEPNR